MALISDDIKKTFSSGGDGRGLGEASIRGRVSVCRTVRTMDHGTTEAFSLDWVGLVWFGFVCRTVQWSVAGLSINRNGAPANRSSGPSTGISHKKGHKQEVTQLTEVWSSWRKPLTVGSN